MGLAKNSSIGQNLKWHFQLLQTEACTTLTAVVQKPHQAFPDREQVAGKTSLPAGNPGTQLHGGTHSSQQKAGSISQRQHLIFHQAKPPSLQLGNN